VLHFDTTTISRAEEEHAVLKRQLRFSTEDLKTVIDDINLLLTNEAHDHLIAINEVKDRFLMRLRKSIFQQLTAYVSSYALRKIADQYSLLIDRSTTIFSCTRAFTTSIRLSCSHKIQQRMYETDESLLLKDVHSH
jgi:catabolite regulation protein CreA